MNLVVIGAQWGDEGKGKIVDYLAREADIVVRYSGGANAGHTVVTDDTTYKLHLVPSGIIYPDKIVVLGIGMVIDPEALFNELNMLEKMDVRWKGRVLISDRAHITLPQYKKIDMEMDAKRKRPIGTTGRGIGVTYAMKAQRDGVRVVDVLDRSLLKELNHEDSSFISGYIDRISEMTIDTSSYLFKNMQKNILFEGAQGVLLDPDLGTYPYVSSGYSSAAGASQGSGIGPKSIDRIIGVCKAYSTRVGNGPFPTEFKKERDGQLEEKIREKGREYGVTTGRPRRCGYLDMVALRYACRTNCIDSLALTHLDVYDEMDELKACVAYEYQGKKVEEFPASLEVLNKATPVLITFKGWKTAIGSCRSFDELPRKARKYIEFIEEFTGTPVDIISVGYERKQTILRREMWIKY
ncbi:MAG: adenylosuccinate synthase [Spirochaetes bacterium]|nr:MAG: adenylosuccinate synthase [Spirochaetota bacterium]